MIDEDQARQVLVEEMGTRGTTCLCGRPTKNRRYCSQSCYHRFSSSTWKDDVPPAMRRKLLKMLEAEIAVSHD
jgi:hypothetical protein